MVILPVEPKDNGVLYRGNLRPMLLIRLLQMPTVARAISPFRKKSLRLSRFRTSTLRRIEPGLQAFDFGELRVRPRFPTVSYCFDVESKYDDEEKVEIEY